MQAEDVDLIDRLTAGEIYLNPVRHDVLGRVVPTLTIAPWTTIVAINRSPRREAAAHVRARGRGDGAVCGECYVVTAGRSNEQLSVAIAILL